MAHQSCLCNFCVLKESFFWAYVTSPLDFNICSPWVNITKTFLLPPCFLLGIQRLFFYHPVFFWAYKDFSFTKEKDLFLYPPDHVIFSLNFCNLFKQSNLRWL